MLLGNTKIQVLECNEDNSHYVTLLGNIYNICKKKFLNTFKH